MNFLLYLMQSSERREDNWKPRTYLAQR